MNKTWVKRFFLCMAAIAVIGLYNYQPSAPAIISESPPMPPAYLARALKYAHAMDAANKDQFAHHYIAEENDARQALAQHIGPEDTVRTTLIQSLFDQGKVNVLNPRSLAADVHLGEGLAQSQAAGRGTEVLRYGAQTPNGRLRGQGTE